MLSTCHRESVITTVGSPALAVTLQTKVFEPSCIVQYFAALWWLYFDRRVYLQTGLPEGINPAHPPLSSRLTVLRIKLVISVNERHLKFPANFLIKLTINRNRVSL